MYASQRFDIRARVVGFEASAASLRSRVDRYIALARWPDCKIRLARSSQRPAESVRIEPPPRLIATTVRDNISTLQKRVAAFDYSDPLSGDGAPAFRVSPMTQPESHLTKAQWHRKHHRADTVMNRCSSRGGARKGGRIMPDAVALFVIIIVLLPMGYLLLAAPAFLLVRLDIPAVTQLLRGMFNVYFLAVTVAGVIGTIVFAVSGLPGFRHWRRLDRGFRVLGAPLVSAGKWTPSLAPGMPAMPTRCAGCGGCIGSACCAMRSSLSPSWAAFPISLPRGLDQDLTKGLPRFGSREH